MRAHRIAALIGGGERSESGFMVKPLRIALVVTTLLAARPAFSADWDISYGPDPSEKLNVCVPQPLRPGSPAVLMIHGGGWRAGSRGGYTNQCKMFAASGIVAIPVDYRLVKPGPGGQEWPAQIDDVQLAMRWVRAHAAQYGIDASHICAEGDSAGAHLALLLDVLTSTAPGDRQDLLPGISSRAACAISISGPSDFLTSGPSLRGSMALLFRAPTPQGVLGQEQAASPALQVHEGDGPALLIHGLSDPAVPFSQAVEMRAALLHAGTNVWLLTHQGGHEMNGMTPRQIQDTWMLIAGFVKTLRAPGAPREAPIGEVLP